MEVKRYNHSISKYIDNHRKLHPHFLAEDHVEELCEICYNAYMIESFHFTKDLSMKIDVGYSVYDSSIKKDSIVTRKKQEYPEYYFNFLPIQTHDSEFSYYTVINNQFINNQYQFALVLQENDICRKIFSFENYKSSSNPFYSIHHNSIFQIVQTYDQDELLLVQIQLGKTLYDTDIMIVTSLSVESDRICICGVPYQDRIIIMNDTQLYFIDLSGQMVNTVNINKYIYMKTFDICCTEKTIIIICSHVYCSREVTCYIAMFYDLDTLTYTGEYEIDYTSEYHEKYYNNNTALTYLSSYDTAVLCSINPDEFLLFSNKDQIFKEEIEDSLTKNTDLYKDVSKLVSDYVGGSILL